VARRTAAQLMRAATERVVLRDAPNGELTDDDRRNMEAMEEGLQQLPRPALDNRSAMVRAIVAQTLSVCTNRSIGDFMVWNAKIHGSVNGAFKKQYGVSITLPDGASRMICDLIVAELGNGSRNIVRAKINGDNTITVTPA
jgi:hypothetical protein